MSQTREDVAAGIASRVRAARTGRRWTLDELAARSGVSRRMLLQIEHAGANPSLAPLLKLAAALDVTLTELVSEASEDKPVAVVSGHESTTPWSTPAGSSARLIVGPGPLAHRHGRARRRRPPRRRGSGRQRLVRRRAAPRLRQP